eukprot:63964-Lingulodinium_polyedra.AAC.1
MRRGRGRSRAAAARAATGGRARAGRSRRGRGQPGRCGAPNPEPGATENWRTPHTLAARGNAAAS